ncbi:NAD(P)/FAD-dependent oxidoreductase [Nodosilinea sp. LEGE 07088]|uniref:NAD(P)/FAD-dependent oxidoreductase n=1 Tax=Nodosilinea sp. LEGE 07088 TaxID=2777968 RepID=UPI001880B2D4|nr:NAD(P)/FAD-dependent oxidoreductase [Nodosilinea sp. LEGE 07088]MBE9138620.1 NAD(P)/FAD-dependent oxidoreductase [Nodosilinea sp. LEGE 07088]
MDYVETVVVGGGPAGSSCAWQLKRQGRDVLVLDKQSFPRLKLCAGWVPAKVMERLEFAPEDYPHSLLTLKTKLYFAPFPFPLLGGWAAPWRTDYSIRRVEFDQWLLARSQAPVITHKVSQIERRGDRYVIDNQFACTYLVGAGGTGCPVKRQLFPAPPAQAIQVATLEKEFAYRQRDDVAHLFFRFHGLPGYAWYVPKGNGFVNIGLAGASQALKQAHTHIRSQWQWFLADLVERGLLDAKTRSTLTPQGHGYYLFDSGGEVQNENAFVVGDAAGLASKDLGEGIGPAIESGLLAANAIVGQAEYRKSAIAAFSLNPSLQWLQYVWS